MNAEAGAHKAGIFGSPENWSDSGFWAAHMGLGSYTDWDW